MRHYCPNCWKDFWGDKPEACPFCGYSFADYHSKDYTEKLINALQHPSSDVKQWAIMILTLRKEKKALGRLKQLRNRTSNCLLRKKVEEAIKAIQSDSLGNA